MLLSSTTGVGDYTDAYSAANLSPAIGMHGYVRYVARPPTPTYVNYRRRERVEPRYVSTFPTFFEFHMYLYISIVLINSYMEGCTACGGITDLFYQR
jgi:hypothetical protein